MFPENVKELKIQLGKKVTEARELDDKRERAWEEVHMLQKEVWQLENGLFAGEDVFVLDGRKWEPGRITRIDVRYGDVRPIVSKFKKDGSLSTRIFYVGYSPKISDIIRKEKPTE